MSDKGWEWNLQFAGIEQSHNYYVYHLISRIFQENPQIKRVIELGTYKGAMSVVLGLETRRKQIPMFTFDITDFVSDESKKLFKALNVYHVIADIWKEREMVKQFILNEPTYLICDNGNKRDEFPEFGRCLAPGSVISVHDYGTEFLDEYTIELNNRIVPFQKDEWTKNDCRFATWLVT